MHTVEPGIWRENRKSWKMRNTHGRTWNFARNSQKPGKLQMHTLGCEIWLETMKNMENKKCKP